MLSLSRVITLVSVAAIPLFAGCSHTVHLALPTGTYVRVITDSREQMIAPSDARYQELQQWLARNQKGWSPVFATNPSGGVLVRAGDLWLQFFDTTVFTRTSEGLLEKKVQPRDYAFLLPRQASNQAMQRTAGRSAFQLSMTSTLYPQPRALICRSAPHPSGFVHVTAWQSVPFSPAVADLVSRQASKRVRHEPLHTDYGMLRMHHSWWATGGILYVYHDRIVIVREGLLPARTYVLARASITALEPEPQLFWFMFSGGLRIIHTVASYPQFLFYSRDVEVLIFRLRQNGFPVATSDA